MEKYVFGVDLGGTTIKFGLLRSDLTLLEQWSIPTNTNDKGADLLKDITDELRKLARTLPPSSVLGVGVGVPGAVLDNGFVKPCVNLNGWGGFNAADQLACMCGWPCQMLNDANAAALGEICVGGGRGKQNAVFVTLGTGVGGGILVGGKLLTGVHGSGGEIGHIKVTDDPTRRCGCGEIGCLEQYASAPGIVQTARELLARQMGGSLMHRYDPLTCKDVFTCAAMEDSLALEAVRSSIQMLGKALAAVSCVCDPEIFVLGGGVSQAGEYLLRETQRSFQRYAFPSAKETQFALAELGNDAGIYGAAYLVLQHQHLKEGWMIR